MKKPLHALDRLEELIITTCIALATAIIFIAVLHRYGMSHLGQLVNAARRAGYPETAQTLKDIYFTLAAIRLTWAQELCIILFVWMAKFGAAYGVRTGIHVGVDVMVNTASEHWKKRLILFGLASGVLFTGIVGALGARFVWHIAGTGQMSPALEAPMWLVYLCIPLGSFLMCFRFLQVAAQFNATGALPKHEIAAVAGLDEPAARSGP